MADIICIYSYNSRDLTEEKQDICKILFVETEKYYPILCNQENFLLKGPTREARVIANEIQAWELFFTDKILENFVRYTNMNIERNEDKIDFKKHTHVKRVDVMEMFRKNINLID